MSPSRFFRSCCTTFTLALLALALNLSVAFAPANASEPRAHDTEKKAVSSPFAPGTGLSVNYASLADIIACLFGPGIEVSNPILIGDPRAFGTFTGGTGILGIASGVVLSSGDVALVPGPNSSDNISRNSGTAGDPDLDGLIPGYSTHDAAVMEFDFTCPGGTDLTIEYVFASEEYNEYVNSNFNDVFGFFLDGGAPVNNLATVPAFCGTSPGIPVSINNVNCGNPFGGAGVNCGCYLNNDLSDGGGTINIEMDGQTRVFTRTVHISPGTHHFKIAIADAGDYILDSNVFLKCGGLACVCPDEVAPSDSPLGAECEAVSETELCATLTWNAPSDPSEELDPSGTCVPVVKPATSYDIRYATTPILTQADFDAATQVSGEPSPAAPGTPESMQVCGLPEGTYYFALVSADVNGNKSLITTASTECSFNHPPDCTNATASETVLWPPNHSYHGISILGVTDPDGDAVTITVTGITQDEPLNTRGDGNTCPDGIIENGAASVRAERSGTPGIPGNGRVYAINFTATDSHGASCSGTVKVCVPHDMSDPTCVDDGQKYNSAGDCQGGNSVQTEVAAYGLSVMGVTANEVTIEFAVPKESKVTVGVFDVTGRRLATLENGTLAMGRYTRTWNMSGVAKGLYYVRLNAGNTTVSRTVLKLQ